MAISTYLGHVSGELRAVLLEGIPAIVRVIRRSELPSVKYRRRPRADQDSWLAEQTADFTIGVEDRGSTKRTCSERSNWLLRWVERFGPI
jgi:hypothetical protein